MPAKLKFLLIYFLSWVVFFDLMRLLFLLYHADKTGTLSWSTIFQTFWYGLRMDLSVAAYILAPMVLFVLLSLFVHFFRRLTVYRIYTFIVLLLVSVICLVDLELYQAWGFRIDTTPLKFLTTPREAMASMSHLPLIWILVFFVLCYALFYFCFTVLMKWIFFQQQNRRIGLTAVVLLVFLGLLIIPIRGGLQLAPLNQSSVYFSTQTYANHVAINASWNFLHSLFSKDNPRNNPYDYFAGADAIRITDSLYSSVSPEGVSSRGLSLSDQWIHSGKPMNVIVLIWESFTTKATRLSIGGTVITPRFNALKREGILFEESFASGDRTNKGLPAVLSGYPAMPNTTIIHSPNKSAKLAVLPQLFKQRGYQTPFYYGGETEFANIKSYLLHGGFDPIIGRDDFSPEDMNSKWGAHDGTVMKKLLQDLHSLKEPFFCSWLTLSSHEPFETPLPPVLKGKDNTSMFLNSMHYTDQVLGAFIDSCKQQSWWDHTLIVIVGDHGHPLPETGNRADDFRSPVLWLGGAVTQRGLVIREPVSQLDIATTLVSQFGFTRHSAQLGAKEGAKEGSSTGNNANKVPLNDIDSTYKPFPFSKDLAHPSTRRWAFFNFNDGFGFADTSGVTVFDNVGRQVIMSEGAGEAARVRAGQALMQVYYGDFMGK